MRNPEKVVNDVSIMLILSLSLLFSKIRIRDPNQGGKDVTDEILSGVGRPSSTPTPPHVRRPITEFKSNTQTHMHTYRFSLIFLISAPWESALTTCESNRPSRTVKSSLNTIAPPLTEFEATLPKFPFLYNQEFIFLSKATAYVRGSAPLLKSLIFYPEGHQFYAMHF